MPARAHIFRYSTSICIRIYVCVWFQVSDLASILAINHHHIDKFRYIISFEW